MAYIQGIVIDDRTIITARSSKLNYIHTFVPLFTSSVLFGDIKRANYIKTGLLKEIALANGIDIVDCRRTSKLLIPYSDKTISILRHHGYKFNYDPADYAKHKMYYFDEEEDSENEVSDDNDGDPEYVPSNYKEFITHDWVSESSDAVNVDEEDISFLA
jgi:hypothetical protein